MVWKKNSDCRYSDQIWDLEGNHDATKCIDIDPCSMYESSKIVKDPLMYA